MKYFNISSEKRNAPFSNIVSLTHLSIRAQTPPRRVRKPALILFSPQFDVREILFVYIYSRMESFSQRFAPLISADSCICGMLVHNATNDSLHATAVVASSPSHELLHQHSNKEIESCFEDVVSIDFSTEEAIRGTSR